jgi:hypothetical protein
MRAPPQPLRRRSIEADAKHLLLLAVELSGLGGGDRSESRLTQAPLNTHFTAIRAEGKTYAESTRSLLPLQRSQPDR